MPTGSRRHHDRVVGCGMGVSRAIRVAVLLTTLAVMVIGMVPLSPAQAQYALPGDGLMIIVDYSGSMNAEVGGGQSRIDAARDAVSALVADLPETVNVGLMVYGHRVSSDDSQREQGCQDIETLVEVGPIDRAAMTTVLDDVEPSGFTPIGAALQQAAAELEVVSGRQTIVLVSDGIDTCAPPPACEVATDLVAQGRPLTVETVGFQVDDIARAELECIAAATGGSYRNAPDAASLAAGIQALSSRSFRSYLPVGTDIAGGPSIGNPTAMALGNHVDRLSPGGKEWYSFDIPTGQNFFLTTTLIGQPEQALEEPRSLVMDVYASPPGDDPVPCGRWVALVDDGTQPVSAGVGGGVTREGECTTGAFVASVALTKPASSQEYSMELGLFLSPPNTELVPPGRDTPAVTVSDAPVGGASHTLAPLVEPGVYGDGIRAGERQFWAIRLARGDVLTATVSLVGVEVPATLTTDVVLQLENGARQTDPEGAGDAVQRGEVQTLSGGEVTLVSAPIGADPAGREWVRLPGVYYVTVTADNAGAPAALFDYELALDATSQLAASEDATTAPTSGATSTATPAPTAPDTVPGPAPAQVVGDVPTLSRTTWALLGLGVAVLLGGLVTFVLRQDR